MELVSVSKDGEYLEVHPSTLVQHKELGWRGCEKQDLPGGAEGDLLTLTKTELQTTLDGKGIVYKPSASKAELTALLGK